jgi:histidyl-tRNA synthetase
LFLTSESYLDRFQWDEVRESAAVGRPAHGHKPARRRHRAELYLGSGKFGPQMKYADRRGSPCVVIQGTDEKQKGEVQIKDLIVGAELAGLSKERDDYLKR